MVDLWGHEVYVQKSLLTQEADFINSSCLEALLDNRFAILHVEPSTVGSSLLVCNLHPTSVHVMSASLAQMRLGGAPTVVSTIEQCAVYAGCSHLAHHRVDLSYF